jgi:4-oxalocrotonate tautomerase
MPLVRIDLVAGKSIEFRKTLGEIVYQAMRETIDVPANDKFQVITEHAEGEINVAENYLGNTYTRDIVLIQITLNAGRTVEMKKAFFKKIADDIHAQLNLRRDDVVINLVEVVKENWSFGGAASRNMPNRRDQRRAASAASAARRRINSCSRLLPASSAAASNAARASS